MLPLSLSINAVTATSTTTLTTMITTIPSAYVNITYLITDPTAEDAAGWKTAQLGQNDDGRRNGL